VAYEKEIAKIRRLALEAAEQTQEPQQHSETKEEEKSEGSWLSPVSIGLGLIVAGVVGYFVVNHLKEQNTETL
jgi:hypothetical protein